MVTIKEATTKKMLRQFRDFPDKLHAGKDYYVPDLKMDEMNMYLPQKNGAFDYCDAKFFLAYKGEEIVGRVAGILVKAANEKYGTKTVRFSRIEFIDDIEVSGALLGAVEDWAKSLGMTEVTGPHGFSDLDKEGMQVMGFGEVPLSITYNNPEYYPVHLEKHGYTKEVDWVEYKIAMPDPEDEAFVRIKRIANIALKRNNLELLKFKKISDVKPYIAQIFDLLNTCYKDLFGYVPLSTRQANDYLSSFMMLLNPDYAKFIIDKDDNLVAFGLAAPWLAGAFKKSKGKLFPFGFIPILRAKTRGDRLVLYLVAVHPKYQSSGIVAPLITNICEAALKNGIQITETGPELEDNLKVQQLWKGFDRTQHKRRRCFVKHIG